MYGKIKEHLQQELEGISEAGLFKKERIIANADIFDFEISEKDMKVLDAMDRGKRFGPDPDNFDF